MGCYTINLQQFCTFTYPLLLGQENVINQNSNWEVLRREWDRARGHSESKYSGMTPSPSTHGHSEITRV